ncbi:MAG: hypothetical protein ACI93R_004098 [Flavobacteriales bacterium]
MFVDGERKLVRFNLGNGRYQLYSVSHKDTGLNLWAQVDEATGMLYFSGADNTLYALTGDTKVPLPGLEDVEVAGKFFIQQGQLVFSDKHQRVWLYSLKDHTRLHVASVEGLFDIDAIDVKSQRLLLSKIVAANKELVVFY